MVDIDGGRMSVSKDLFIEDGGRYPSGVCLSLFFEGIGYYRTQSSRQAFPGMSRTPLPRSCSGMIKKARY
jgi:hypothetical protein